MSTAYAKKLDQIITLLDKEASSIKQGEFGDIGKMIEMREALVEATIRDFGGKESKHQEKWRDIYSKSERNTQLIQAAMNGVNAVSDIVAAIKSSSTKLNTYSKGGSVADIAIKSTVHERKV